MPKVFRTEFFLAKLEVTKAGIQIWNIWRYLKLIYYWFLLGKKKSVQTVGLDRTVFESQKYNFIFFSIMSRVFYHFTQVK